MHTRFHSRRIGLLFTLLFLIMMTGVSATETPEKAKAYKEAYFTGKPPATHPPEILKAHPATDFGCVGCHQELGEPVSAESLKGAPDANAPLVPLTYSQALCLGCHETPVGLAGAEKAALGRKLFLERGCVGCHVVTALDPLPLMSTPLDGVAKKIKEPNWIAAWIEKPGAVRPGTRMPSFRLKPGEIPDVVMFLQSMKETLIPLSSYQESAGKVDEGKRVFTEKGCIGCHSIERGKAGVTPRVPNLADAGIKLDASWLKTWLEKPMALMPTTPMPQVTLSPEEQAHLTAYLMSLKDGEVARLVKTTPLKGDPGKGKETVQALGCFGCHEIKAMKEIELVGVPLSETAVKKVADLSFGDTKVERNKWTWLSSKMKQADIFQTAEKPMKAPDFELNDEEIEALTTYYLNNRLYPLPEKYLRKKSPAVALQEKGDWMLEHFNCTGCHQVIEEAPKPHIDAYYDLKTMAPPRLVGQGARVQSEWFYKYLEKPEELRPWLKIRMPTFNLDEKGRNDFIAYFATLVAPDDKDIAQVPYTTKLVKTDYDPEVLQMGEYRVVTDKCMQCHPVSMDGSLPENVKLEDLSINLMLSKTRLRFEWIKRFLKDPDKYAGKGTKMPYIYYTPDGVPKISDADMWINYASLYLAFMEKVPEVREKKAVEDSRSDANTDWSNY